jgi:hypothetical protein
MTLDDSGLSSASGIVSSDHSAILLALANVLLMLGLLSSCMKTSRVIMARLESSLANSSATLFPSCKT